MSYYDDGASLGDILGEALKARDFKSRLIEVTLHAPKGIRNKISNIKALREATRVRDGIGSPNYDGAIRWTGDCMGLTEAKAAIETIMDFGYVKLRMSPDNYGRFMVNRHDLNYYDWQVKDSRYYDAPEVKREPPVFTL